MSNTLGGYDLTIFMQEALIRLHRRLGIASRIHRGYDPSPQRRGSTIVIPVRGEFVVMDAPSTAQDIDAAEAKIKLDQWKEVKFALPDNQGQYTEDRIIEDHIEPAAFALAAYIDAQLAGLYKRVPWFKNQGSDVIDDIVDLREKLADQGVPLNDGRLHLAVDHRNEANLLKTDVFRSAQIVGGTDNQDALMNGQLGRRFGFEIFANGVMQSHASGTVVSAGTDSAGALNGAAAKGAEAVNIDGLSGAETLKEGDSFVIAGNTQRYVVTTGKVLAGGAANGVGVFPALVQDYADNAVVTFENATTAGSHADAYSANLGFHRDFAALAMAPLQDQMGSAQARREGKQVEVINDPETNISLRGRMWYDADNSRTVVALDILFGVAVLNPNMAAVLRRDT
jgi:hypothetical protein